MKKFTKFLIVTAVVILTIIMTVFTVSAATREVETNNDYASATVIGGSTDIMGTLSSSSDIDYYKYVATADGKLEIKFKHTYVNSGNRWRVKVIKDNDGEKKILDDEYIYLNGSENVTLPYVGVVKGGTYYISVERYNDVVGKEYGIVTKFTASSCYEKEINDDYNKATNVTLGETYDGVMNSNNDIDYYKIVPTENGKINLVFKHVNESPNGRWIVKIFMDNDGVKNELSSQYIYLNDAEKITLPFIGAVKGGTYYVSIDNYSSTVGKDYRLATSFTKSDYYEKEINKEYSQATKISLNNTYTGTMNSSSDTDMYKITAPAAGTVTVKFNHTPESKNHRWYVYVYAYGKSDGSYNLLSNTYVINTSAKTVTLPNIGASKGSVFYIRVSNYTGTEGLPYKLDVSFKLATPSKLKVASYSTSSVKLSWGKVKDADGYQIYKYDSSAKKYKKLASTSGTSYTVKNLNSGKKYKFEVRAYKKSGDETYYSNYSKLTAATKTGAPNPSVSSPSKKTVKLSWKKISGAEKYQAYYSTSKSGSYKKLTTTSKTSYTTGKLTSGKTYYFKVRAYVTAGDTKYYSAWSSIKKIKCK